MQPLFYGALAAAAGIAAAALGPVELAPLAWPALWVGLGLAFLIALPFRRRAAGLGLALCLCAGYARARHDLDQPAGVPQLLQQAARLEPKPRDRAWVTGYLRDTPEALYQDGRIATVRLDLEAVSIAPAPQAAAVWPAAGGVRLYAYPPQARAAFHGPYQPDQAPDPEAGPPPADATWAAPLLALPAGAGLAFSAHLRPPHVYHDPGVADFGANNRRQGIVATATLPLDAWRRWPALAGGRGLRLRARLWGWISRGVDGLAPPGPRARVNGLLRGMLLGDTARLDEATRTDFQVDGVYHLLVVAGLHMGVLAAFLLWLFRRGRLPATAAAAACLAVLTLYAWVIAGRTPTERALLMLAFYFGARLWYRERPALNAVGAAALVLLAWHPLDLFASGFQMSLGAAVLLAGVALPWLRLSAAPRRQAAYDLGDPGRDLGLEPRWAQWRLDLRALAERLGWIWRPLGYRALPGLVRAGLWVYELVVISFVLQLGFAAFNVLYFHRTNPWSVAANALLVPGAALLIPLSWAAIALTAAFPALTGAAAAVVGHLGQTMLAAAAMMAGWPLAGLRVPSPPGWFLYLFSAGVGGWVWIWARAAASPRPPPDRARGWRQAMIATAALAGLVLVMVLCPFPPRLPPGLSATVLDVGQGDSIFVAFPDRRTLLVDGGPRSAHWDSGEEVVAPFLWSLGLKRIDAVLLTHGHNDHIGGLPTVIANFHPGEVWLTRSLPPDAAVRDLLRQVAASGARLRRCAAGDAFLAGASRLEVLLPAPQYQAGLTATNDDSMVVRVSWRGEAMMLTGDAQSPGERWLVQQRFPLQSVLLKVGHHGSNTSSTPAFLAAVQPRAAIISVGAGNIYGLPSAAVLQRFQADGIRVFRTDENGAVQARLAPGQLSIYLFRRLPGQ